MELKGKNIAFLGDSITEGYGATSAEKRYTDVFQKLSGANVTNYGIGGTRLARQTKKTEDNPHFDLDFCMRSLEMKNGLDAIVVFGGTNDFGHGDAPLGTFDDRTPYTLYGALHTLYSTLIKKYPTAKILVLTPLHRHDEFKDINPNRVNNYPLKTCVNAIKEVAEYYSIDVLDLYAKSGMCPFIEEQLNLYYDDGLHPNDAGYAKLADILYAYFKTL